MRKYNIIFNEKGYKIALIYDVYLGLKNQQTEKREDRHINKTGKY